VRPRPASWDFKAIDRAAHAAPGPPKKPARPCPPAAGRPPLTLNHSLPFFSLSSPSLLAGKSGVAAIDRFDATEFPTKFAAQIRNFDNEE